jgi:outer membrane protein, heavy metal efflux system
LSRAPRHVLRRALKDFGRAPSWPASVFAAVLVVGAGAAQSLTMDEAFDRFVERSPLAAAERMKIDIARERLRQSGTWTNPVLSYNQEGYPLGQSGSAFNEQEFLLGAWQEFELGGKRGKRRELARLELAAATAQYRDFLRRRRLEVSRLFVEAFYASKRRDALQSVFQEYAGIREAHRQRYEMGEISGLAHLKIEGEEAWYVIQLARAERQWNAAWSELAALVGWENGTVPELIVQQSDPVDLPDSSVLVETALRTRPDLEAVRIEARAAEAEIALERARNIPDLNVGGGYKRDFGRDSFFIGLQLPIPLWDRRHGAIGEKIAAGRRQGMLSSWKEIWVRQEVERAFSLYSRLLAASGRLSADFLHKLDRTVSITTVSYQQGEAGILEYLDAFRARRDALLEFSQLSGEVQLARLELEASVGTSLRGVSP